MLACKHPLDWHVTVNLGLHMHAALLCRLHHIAFFWGIITPTCLQLRITPWVVVFEGICTCTTLIVQVRHASAHLYSTSAGSYSSPYLKSLPGMYMAQLFLYTGWMRSGVHNGQIKIALLV